MPFSSKPGEDSPFDRLTALARAIFDAPSAMASLVEDERTLFHSSVGFPQTEMPREQTVSHILVEMGPDASLVIEDATADPRTADHPMVTQAPFLRWFAGMTISDGQGRAVGAFGVMDVKPRPAPSQDQMEALAQLARLAGDIVDRAREAREREDQLTMLRLAEQMSGVGHWRWDVHSGRIKWSDEVYRIHGLEPQSIEPTLAGMLEQYDEGDRPELRRLVTRAVEAGEGYSFRMQLIRKDGARRWVVADAVASVDPATGKTESLFGLLQDVTEQQEALDQVRRSEERYRLLAENTGDVIARVRRDGTSKYISPAIEALLGWRCEEMTGRALEYVHPDDRDLVMETVRRTIDTGRPHNQEHRAVHRNGSTVWVECRFQTIAETRHPQGEVVVVIRDIDERKALETALRDAKETAEAAAEAMAQSEARYRQLADRSSDIIVTFDTESVVTYVSPSVTAVTGLKPEEVVGRSVANLIYPPDVVGALKDFQAFLEGGPAASRYRLRGKDGDLRWMEARRTMVRDGKGRFTAFQDVVRDITATKALEEQLTLEKERAEAAARTKSAFLANMSHELRTPLTSVIGFSGLLKQSRNLGEEDRRHVERVSAGSEALLSVINDILDYSKLEAGAVEMDPAPFDARALAMGVADLIGGQVEARGLTLDVTVSDAVPDALMGDEGRLRQVLLNLLSNAVKFTAQGGVSLTLDASPGEDGRHWIAATVTDTGIGISSDKAAQLFERFVQADLSTTRTYGGTGLGLAISRQLIEMMGGEIGAHGAPGQGSTFWFRVPLAPAEAATASSLAAPAEALGRGRILVADDAPANRELVTAILGHLGLETMTVENGVEAVAAARTDAFDLILMDVHMPVMDGLDAARAIRALDGPAARTPILALTANVGAEQVQACLEAGMDGHLAKPIEIERLVSTLAAWLAEPEAEAQEPPARRGAR